MTERGIPRTGYKVVHEGNEVGDVTSGTMSPLLGIGIGMAYVPKDLAAYGTEISIQIRNKQVKAEVVKTPFIQK